MADQLLGALHATLTSPWVYVCIFVLVWLDGFFPVVPSETALVSAAVFAVSGTPHWAGLLAAAALGALAGDLTAYAIGRRLRGGAGRWAARRPRRAAVLTDTTRTLHRRGGLLVLVGRFIPGGRTAVTTAAGLTAFPLRTFVPWVAVGAALWAAYGTAMGAVGGAAFAHEPWKAVALGLALATSAGLLIEGGRFVRDRRVAAREQAAALPASAVPPVADTLVR